MSELQDIENKFFVILKKNEEKTKEINLSISLLKKTLAQDFNKNIDFISERITKLFNSVKSLNNVVLKQNDKI